MHLFERQLKLYLFKVLSCFCRFVLGSKRNIVEFPRNTLGIAAGLDKNGELLYALEYFGFEFVEVGTVVRYPQKPNPGVIVRKGKDVLWNAMGFPSGGVEVVKKNLEDYRKERGNSLYLIASIGANRGIEDLNTIQKDLQYVLESLEPQVNAFCVNFASPNTKNLREKMEGEGFLNLLKALRKKTKKKMFLKLHPDFESEEALTKALKLILDAELDGVIYSNTTKQRPQGHEKFPSHGGLSGKILLENNLKKISFIRSILGSSKLLIGCGGVMSEVDFKRYLEKGSDAAQVYTGFVLSPFSFFRKSYKKA